MYMKLFWFNETAMFKPDRMDGEVNEWITSVQGKYKIMNISQPQFITMHGTDEYFLITVVYVER